MNIYGSRFAVQEYDGDMISARTFETLGDALIYARELADATGNAIDVLDTSGAVVAHHDAEWTRHAC